MLKQMVTQDYKPVKNQVMVLEHLNTKLAQEKQQTRKISRGDN